MLALQQFVRSLRSELEQAQQTCAGAGSVTRVVAMEVVMAATVECIDASGTLALRVGRLPGRKQRAHQLCIEVPDNDAQAIAVRLDGDLFEHYASPDHAQAH